MENEIKQVKRVNLAAIEDPDLFGLINEYASFLDLLPTTAIKRFLKRSLPRAIRNEQRHLTQFNRQKQAKS